MRAAVYIPNFNGAAWIRRTLASLAAGSRPLPVVVADNGSTDGSADMVRADFPDTTVLELGANLGFGTALNRAVAAHPAELVILLNYDVECEPRFCEALIDGLGEGDEMAAGVLTREDDPGTIDSAGIVADRTLMGFDYLQGEPISALAGAADPLGPTGGAALYRKRAWDAVGGFDERIFLYYEDLDLALRIAAGGGRCRLAPDARALHAYSAALGPASAAKYTRTGWSRGYMLRRYGVMRRPAGAAHVLTVEGTLLAGQLLRDRTAAGARGRLRGWREAAGLPERDAGAAPLLDLSAREAIEIRRRRRG